MGFLLWGVLTALTLYAGLSLTLRLGKELTIGDQIVAAVITAVTTVLGTIEALGYASILYGWVLGPIVTALDVGVIILARPEAGAWKRFGERLRSAARRSVLTPVGIFASIPAVLLFIYMGIYVWYLPTWGWDALWYHEPTAAYAFQNHSLSWVDTHVPFINSYPKTIELLGLWNVIFCPDDRLIEGVQLPLALMTVVAIASLCRRCGASPSASLALGVSWIFLPAVILNIPSGYNDSGAASLRIAAILFLARGDARTAHRVFGTLALGDYLGSKVSALAHAGILAVVVAIALAVEIKRTPDRTERWRLALQPIPMTIAIVALGGATYIRDLVRYGNPVWPAKVNLFGYTLPGTWEWGAFDKPPWGGPGGIGSMWRSFHEHARAPLVDIRAGGFGPLWLYVLLPLAAIALVIAAWRLFRHLPTPGILSILAFAGTAVATGAPWWPRHVMALPVAGLIGCAIVVSQVRWRFVGATAAAVILACSMAEAWPMREGFKSANDMLKTAFTLPPDRRAQLKVGGWNYPGIEKREEIIQPGDAAIYDDKSKFIYQLWRYDWKSRVLYRPVQGDPKKWLEMILADGAKFAVMTRGAVGESTLRDAGWIAYGKCPVENATVWVRPAAGAAK